MFRFTVTEMMVRQVNRDELTYELFSAMRGWTASLRKLVAEEPHKVPEMHRTIAAGVIQHHVQRWQIYFPGEAEPLGRDALIGLFRRAIEAWPRALRQSFIADRPELRARARYDAALLLCDALDDFEILVDAPEPPPFSFANFTGESGVPAVAEA